MAERLNILLDPEDAAWVTAEAERRGCTRPEVLRQLVQSARVVDRATALVRVEGELLDALDVPADGRYLGTRKQQAQKARAVELIEDLFNLAPVGREIGVDRGTLYDWMREDGQFRSDLLEAREMRLHNVERWMVDIGMKRAKGDWKPLVAFCNAHHPGYGVLRKEQMERVLRPFVENVADVLRQELPSSAAESIRAKLAVLVESAVLGITC